MRTTEGVIRGGQGRTEKSLATDALTFGLFAAIGTVLLGLVLVLGGCKCVDGMPVVPGDKTRTDSDKGG